jgi:hypothetical protein
MITSKSSSSSGPLITATYNTSAGQSIPNSGADAIVNFDTKIDDPFNCVTTGASWIFTVPAGGAGIYYVHASTLYDTTALVVGQQTIGKIKINGSQVAGVVAGIEGTSTTYTDVQISYSARLSVGDTIQFTLNNIFSASKPLIADGNYNYINITRLGS